MASSGTEDAEGRRGEQPRGFAQNRQRGAFEFGGFGGHGGNGFGGNGGGGDHIDGGFAGAHMSGGDFHAAQSGGNCWNSLFPTNPAWRQRHAGDKTC
jgi:hypothetical protein